VNETLAAHRLTGPGAQPRFEHISAHLTQGVPLKSWLGGAPEGGSPCPREK